MARTSFALVMLGHCWRHGAAARPGGDHGVISYSVSQRTAKSASAWRWARASGQLRRMFVRNGLALAALGVVCGLGAAIAFTRWMASLLFDVRPLDPLTYAAVAVALFAAAALASYLPSRRATSIDPVEALRAD